MHSHAERGNDPYLTCGEGACSRWAAQLPQAWVTRSVRCTEVADLGLLRSFPRSAWECRLGRSASSWGWKVEVLRSGDAERHGMRSHAERENDPMKGWSRMQDLIEAENQQAT